MPIAAHDIRTLPRDIKPLPSQDTLAKKLSKCISKSRLTTLEKEFIRLVLKEGKSNAEAFRLSHPNDIPSDKKAANGYYAVKGSQLNRHVYGKIVFANADKSEDLSAIASAFRVRNEISFLNSDDKNERLKMTIAGLANNQGKITTTVNVLKVGSDIISDWFGSERRSSQDDVIDVSKGQIDE